MHMLSRKDLSSGELKILRTSRNPTTVTAHGEVQTNEEAQENVHDLDLFVTVQMLDDTLAVLSSGKLCEEHGYTFEWASGRTPHLTKDGKGFYARRKMSCFLLSRDCRQAPAQVRLLHRFRKTPQQPLRVQPGNRRDPPQSESPKPKFKKEHPRSSGKLLARPSRVVRGVHR